MTTQSPVYTMICASRADAPCTTDSLYSTTVELYERPMTLSRKHAYGSTYQVYQTSRFCLPFFCPPSFHTRSGACIHPLGSLPWIKARGGGDL
jgi:hypothetical protein